MLKLELRWKDQNQITQTTLVDDIDEIYEHHRLSATSLKKIATAIKKGNSIEVPHGRNLLVKVTPQAPFTTHLIQ